VRTQPRLDRDLLEAARATVGSWDMR